MIAEWIAYRAGKRAGRRCAASVPVARPADIGRALTHRVIAWTLWGVAIAIVLLLAL